MRKVKLKLKPIYINIFKYVGIFLILIFLVYIYYSINISSITKLGYSRKAANNILFTFKSDYVRNKEYSKVLDEAFKNKEYNEKNLDIYSEIKYSKHDNLIKVIDKLINIGYKSRQISLIIKSGSDKDIEKFASRKKERYIEDFLDFPFSKLANYDRYIAYSDLNGTKDEDTVVLVNLLLDKENYTDYYENNKYSIDMLINRHFKCSNTLDIPLVQVDDKYKYNKKDTIFLSRDSYDAYKIMYEDMAKSNLLLKVNTGYVSYDEQEALQKEYYTKYHNTNIPYAGFSEYQSGLAIGFAGGSNKIFSKSEEYKWLVDNAYKYGFIERYTKKYSKITGFREEAWHFRYVGVKISTYIKNHPMAYEEYYARYVDK